MSERTCLRCGAPYEEGATVCFTCGASIGELETPTQPVRTPKARAASVDALPPSDGVAEIGGAPPVAVAAESAPLSEPIPRRVTVGSSLPVAAPAPKPARKARRWPWIVGVVVLVVLVGGGIALRAALAGPPVPSSVTYHDPAGRFSFTVPALWSVTRQDNGALVTDSSGANSVTITAAPAQANQTAVSVANALALSQKLQPAAPMQVGGDTWQQRSGQVTGQDGATREIVALVDVRSGVLYTIQLSSPSASYASVNNLAYQPLLASFTFR